MNPGGRIEVSIEDNVAVELTARRGRLVVETAGIGFIDLSEAAKDWLSRSGAGEGLLTLFIRHTSASLTIQENADPDVQADLLDSLARLAPEHTGYRHDSEGPDDMPAHVKAMLTSTHVAVPVTGGRPVLGTWQGIYLVEHRRAPHRREISMLFIGA